MQQRNPSPDHSVARPSGIPTNLNDAQLKLDSMGRQLTDYEKRLSNAEKELRAFKELTSARQETLNTSLNFHRMDMNLSIQSLSQSVNNDFEKLYDDMNSQHRALELQVIAIVADFNSSLDDIREQQNTNIMDLQSSLNASVSDLSDAIASSTQNSNNSISKLQDDFNDRLAKIKLDNDVALTELRDDSTQAVQSLEGKMEKQKTGLMAQINRLKHDINVRRYSNSKSTRLK